MGEDLNQPELSASAVDRRKILKRMGAAGAVAWTAPVLVDSMVSPAAAATVTPGCYVMYTKLNAANPQNTNNPQPFWSPWQGTQYGATGLTCTPTAPAPCGSPQPATAAQTAAVNLPSPPPNDNTEITVSVNTGAAYSCRIVGAAVTLAVAGTATDPTRCQIAGSSNDFGPMGGTSITITPTDFLDRDNWDLAYGSTSQGTSLGIIIQCGI